MLYILFVICLVIAICSCIGRDMVDMDRLMQQKRDEYAAERKMLREMSSEQQEAYYESKCELKGMASFFNYFFIIIIFGPVLVLVLGILKVMFINPFL